MFLGRSPHVSSASVRRRALSDLAGDLARGRLIFRRDKKSPRAVFLNFRSEVNAVGAQREFHDRGMVLPSLSEDLYFSTFIVGISVTYTIRRALNLRRIGGRYFDRVL